MTANPRATSRCFPYFSTSLSQSFFIYSFCSDTLTEALINTPDPTKAASVSASRAEATPAATPARDEVTQTVKRRKTQSFPKFVKSYNCLLYTSPSPRDVEESRMPSSA